MARQADHRSVAGQDPGFVESLRSFQDGLRSISGWMRAAGGRPRRLKEEMTAAVPARLRTSPL